MVQNSTFYLYVAVILLIKKEILCFIPLTQALSFIYNDGNFSLIKSFDIFPVKRLFSWCGHLTYMYACRIKIHKWQPTAGFPLRFWVAVRVYSTNGQVDTKHLLLKGYGVTPWQLWKGGRGHGKKQQIFINKCFMGCIGKVVYITGRSYRLSR